jgi:hypothetical protein
MATNGEPKSTGETPARGLIVAVGAAVAAFAVGLALGVSLAPEVSPGEPAGGADPSPSARADLLQYRPATPRQPFDRSIEPFDFDPAPPLEETPIDGFYLRIIDLDEVGGPRLGLPFHCRRCPLYRIDPGVETLLLHRGRFWIEHQISGFRAYGHYEVEDDRVTVYNDPNCSRVRGEYRWARSDGQLSFDVVDDPCAFAGERANDLMFSTWTAVRPCLSGVRYWWPALVGCTGGESGVRP